MSNPYDSNKHEAQYMAYEHGANSEDESDNPYMDQQDDPEALALSAIWKKGFNSVAKKRGRPPKAKVEQVDQLEDIPEQFKALPVDTVSFLESTSDEQLLKELQKRKEPELLLLLKQQEELTLKINKLKAILELK
jgi:hypothetical protein